MDKYLNVILVIFILLTTVGCKDLEDYTQTSTLVVIAGVHSNSQVIDVPLIDKIEKTYSSFGNVGIIVADGTPNVVYNDEGNILGSYNDSYVSESKKIRNKNKDAWQKNYLTVQTAAINKQLASLKPDSPEIDTMAALQEAEKLFNIISSKEDENKEIIIYDTGLATCGAVNFLNNDFLNLLNSDKRINENDVKDLLDSLENKAEIPNLSGVKVTWYGLGAVAEPQNKLSNLNIANLKVIWGEILNCANAVPPDIENDENKYTFFVSTTSSRVMEYTQPVSVIIDWDTIYDYESVNEMEKKGIPILSEEKLKFEPNSAKLCSQEDAAAVLLPYAMNLMNYENMRILLVGTTADPNRNGGSIELSNSRANEVKKCLVSLGIEEERIYILGLGANSPFYDDKEWENDVFNESIAKTNRAVILLPYDSKLAQHLITK